MSCQSIYAHPLDPLTAEEVTATSRFIVNKVFPKHGLTAEKKRFASISLLEPPKAYVLEYKSGDPIERQALAVIIDCLDKTSYECAVSLSKKEELYWKELKGQQPALHVDEFSELEEVVVKNEEFIKAMAKRGLTDPSAWMVEPWSAGYMGHPDEEGRRLVRALTWVRLDDPCDNGYAHPVQGLVAVVDLHEMKVVKIEDHEVVDVPRAEGNYASKFIQDFRPDPKPISITQPEGVNFVRKGNLLEWQKWSVRIGWNMREGLVLHTIGYEDKGVIRPVVYRASLSEMVVPYGSPSPIHCRKNAFDMGEYGLGQLANSLELGCDCLGVIEYFDGVINSSLGEGQVQPNVVCIHEEDCGLLWKHSDWRLGKEGIESRRSTRLVISFLCTVSNYEYGFFWYFYLDGTIQLEVKMTGLVNTTAIPTNQESRYGTLVAPGLEAQIHQHFFCMRLDMNVDGPLNSVVEVNTQPEDDDQNPYGNAFRPVETRFKTEKEAQRRINPQSDRIWKIINSNNKNAMGKPVAWKLVPVNNCFPFYREDSWLMKRAQFIKNQFWVTRYDPSEMFAAGDYPNQSKGGEGLAKWAEQDRDIDGQDLVVWYTMGANHVVRLEDWPIMPAHHLSFKLQPCGFFDCNPTLDLPPAFSATSSLAGAGEGRSCCKNKHASK